MHRSQLTAVVAVGLAGLLIAPAAAAVRTCSDTLVSMPGTGKTEIAAKKAALEDWVQKAKVAGYETSLWVTALGRNFSCTKRKGGFDCIASARACVIKQKAPDGFVVTPRVPTKPDDKSDATTDTKSAPLSAPVTDPNAAAQSAPNSDIPPASTPPPVPEPSTLPDQQPKPKDGT